MCDNHLPEPTKCDACGSADIKMTTTDVLHGKFLYDWPYCWYCMSCGAATTCHPNSTKPMGTMAGPEDRLARGRAHVALDKLWKKRYMSRTHVYISLSKHMNLPMKDCHISMFNEEQCERVIEWAKETLRAVKSSNKRKAVYRKGKKQTIRNKGGKW